MVVEGGAGTFDVDFGCDVARFSTLGFRVLKIEWSILDSVV